MAKIYSGSDEDLSFLARVLREGGVVAVPTETVYGLAANALDPMACRQVFEIKGRPAHDPFIVHVADLDSARPLAEFPPLAEDLASRFWPGALTLVLPKHPRIPDIVTSGRPTVAIRAPAHPLLRKLLRICGCPLAAPSANPFGYVSPTTALHVESNLGNRVEHILDGGPATIGVESTIVDVRTETDPVILRPGGVSREDLESATGHAFRLYTRPAEAVHAEPEGELAPGMLDKHYSPRTPVTLATNPFPDPSTHPIDSTVARVYFKRPATLPPDASNSVFWLSEGGDLGQAARRLFSLLRQLDTGGFSRIEFEPVPPSGLGLAINDRLRRAATR